MVKRSMWRYSHKMEEEFTKDEDGAVLAEVEVDGEKLEDVE